MNDEEKAKSALQNLVIEFVKNTPISVCETYLL